ncbi:Membrane-associated kinase regulator 5 [Hirschfeldia incana]|nr:Membrane-associated kinase regulator 5 [Hirschfeldia incana]
MEALTFMKLWLTNTTGNKPRRKTRISESPTPLEDSEVDLCEGDDSFFELEISLSETTFSLSKSKVIPLVEPTSKPQSPTTPLQNSGRKFHALSFRKKENNRSSLNVKFRLEDETKTTSFRKTTSSAKPHLKDDAVFFEDSVSSSVSSPSSVSSVSSSKRFFDLIKPLYNKTTKKQSVNSVTTSPASSPATAREKQRSNIPSGIRRHLGKSRSASAAVGVMSPVKRLDESLQVQQDGIQSAILHCKKSFHGSESYMLSRSSSESYSQEKLSTSSSEDSYLFSRLSSESVLEKSTDSLTSIQEQREKISD